MNCNSSKGLSAVDIHPRMSLRVNKICLLHDRGHRPWSLWPTVLHGLAVSLHQPNPNLLETTELLKMSSGLAEATTLSFQVRWRGATFKTCRTVGHEGQGGGPLVYEICERSSVFASDFCCSCNSEKLNSTSCLCRSAVVQEDEGRAGRAVRGHLPISWKRLLRRGPGLALAFYLCFVQNDSLLRPFRTCLLFGVFCWHVLNGYVFKEFRLKHFFASSFHIADVTNRFNQLY